MKRMVTDEQIIDLIKKYAPGFDPSTIEDGDILQNAIVGLDADGELVKGNLFGKYVRIIPAPDSTTLTDEQIEEIAQGVFMQGNFVGLVNPVFFPLGEYGGYKNGIVMGQRQTGYGTGFEFVAENYLINERTKAIAIQYIPLKITTYNKEITLTADYVNIKGKNLPQYPSNTGKFTYKMVNGTLTWQAGNGLYLHTVVFDVGSGQSFTIRLISDSATTCALDAGTGNFTVPDSTFIQPANMGNVVIVPLDANKFAPDIHAFDSATGAFTNNINLASVTSDTVTPIG